MQLYTVYISISKAFLWAVAVALNEIPSSQQQTRWPLAYSNVGAYGSVATGWREDAIPEPAANACSEPAEWASTTVVGVFRKPRSCAPMPCPCRHYPAGRETLPYGMWVPHVSRRTGPPPLQDFVPAVAVLRALRAVRVMYFN